MNNIGFSMINTNSTNPHEFHTTWQFYPITPAFLQIWQIKVSDDFHQSPLSPFKTPSHKSSKSLPYLWLWRDMNEMNASHLPQNLCWRAWEFRKKSVMEAAPLHNCQILCIICYFELHKDFAVLCECTFPFKHQILFLIPEPLNKVTFDFQWIIRKHCMAFLASTVWPIMHVPSVKTTRSQKNPKQNRIPG